MKCRQEGAVILEFTLVLLLFLTFIFGLIDFSRLLFTWQIANEATREGARYAVACADTTADSTDRIKTRMQTLLPQISKITVDWQPAGCDTSKCEAVTVSITDMKFNWIAPLSGAQTKPIILMPGFSTYLQREMMSYNADLCKVTQWG